MAIEHDTDPNALPQLAHGPNGTDPNYPASMGDRPSYGKLNYGPQMRAETDPNFLTPPSGRAAADEAPPSSEPISSEPVSSGPDSRGARSARHAAKARPVRPGHNVTMKMEEAVQLNETVPLPDAMVAPEVIARRARPLRRDQETQLNDSGKKKVEKKLLGAAVWGIVAAVAVIAICEMVLK